MKIKFELDEKELLYVIENGTLEKMTQSVNAQRNKVEEVVAEAVAPAKTRQPKPVEAPKSEPVEETKPKPVEETKPVEKTTVTLDEVRAALIDAQKAGFKPQELIAEFGATNLSAIPVSKYGDVLKRLAQMRGDA